MVQVRQITPPRRDRLQVSTGFFRFYLAVVVIQGIHVIEHIIQLLQVTVFHVPDDDALGLLGYFLQLHGTEEWLHFGFNASYLLALYALVLLLYERVESGVVPKAAFRVFLVAGAGLESWHMTEHIVIIYNALRNGGGCPCPGIGDRALHISDTYLHFVYNTVAYVGTVVPFWFVYKHRTARRHHAHAPLH
jgi:hypothetical protein